MRSPLAFLILGLAGASLGAVSLAAEDTAKNETVEIVRPEGERTPKEASLQVGMSAQQVREILGKPSEVKPLQSPSGKAEVWSYVTRTELGRERLQVGSNPIKALVKDSSGRDREVVISNEPIWGTRRKVEVRTYSVLVFNDQFMNDKVVVRVEQSLE